jgi:hypothetical protein
MQSDTDRKGIRSTRRPRLDVDIGSESNDLAIVQRSKDARGVERGEHYAGNYQSPQQADLQNRRRQDGIQRQASPFIHAAAFWNPSVAGLESLVRQGAIVREDEFWLPANVVRQKPRNRRDAALSLRRPDRIAALEYRLAVNAVLSGSVAASKSELAASVARVLGFDRTGNGPRSSDFRSDRLDDTNSGNRRYRRKTRDYAIGW